MDKIIKKLNEVLSKGYEVLSDLYSIESKKSDTSKKSLDKGVKKQYLTIKATAFQPYIKAIEVEGVGAVHLVYKNQINKDGIIVPMSQITQGYMLKSASDFKGYEGIDKQCSTLLGMVKNLYEQGSVLASATILDSIRECAEWCLPKDTVQILYSTSNTALKRGTIVSRALLSAFDLKAVKEREESKGSDSSNFYKIEDSLRVRKFYQKLEQLVRAGANNDRIVKAKSESEKARLLNTKKGKKKAKNK